MGIVTNIVAADDDEYGAVGESSCPLDAWSGIEVAGLDTAKMATLHSLFMGDTFQEALDSYQPVYVSESNNIVLRMADGLVDKLIAIDEEALECMASELAATEAFEREQWTTEAVVAQLTALVELAQLADSQGQFLFVWMSLSE